MSDSQPPQPPPASSHSPAAEPSESSHHSTPSSSTAATPSSPFLVPPTFPAHLLTPLLEMGFPMNRVLRGLHATGGVSWERAMEWIFAHAEDGDIDEPLLVAPAKPNQAATSSAAASSASASPASAATPSLPSLSSYSADTPYKLVLLVRQDLRMRVGKIGAQTAHAAVGTVLQQQEYGSPVEQQALRRWLHQGQAKVVLAIKDLEEMEQVEQRAKQHGLQTFIVQDAGRTQVEAGSQTVLAIGPAPIPMIDGVTGHLKLL